MFGWVSGSSDGPGSLITRRRDSLLARNLGDTPTSNVLQFILDHFVLYTFDFTYHAISVSREKERRRERRREPSTQMAEQQYLLSDKIEILQPPCLQSERDCTDIRAYVEYKTLSFLERGESSSHPPK